MKFEVVKHEGGKWKRRDWRRRRVDARSHACIHAGWINGWVGDWGRGCRLPRKLPSSSYFRVLFHAPSSSSRTFRNQNKSANVRALFLSCRTGSKPKHNKPQRAARVGRPRRHTLFTSALSFQCQIDHLGKGWSERESESAKKGAKSNARPIRRLRLHRELEGQKPHHRLPACWFGLDVALALTATPTVISTTNEETRTRKI